VLATGAPLRCASGRARSFSMLDAFYFHDPRLTLVPIEHLGPDGIAPSFAQTLAARQGWDEARVELLDEGFALYWSRLEELARRCRELSPPRLRNVGVVHDPAAVRPYTSILNTSTLTLYASDLDPARSDPELVAYVLAHGDRVADVGEVTLAAVHLAPWWFERSVAERDAFRTAAFAATRPDAAVYRAIADALPWLRELRHAQLRPPRTPGGHRPIPGTGLLVPRAHEHEPDALVAACRTGARDALGGFLARYRDPDPDAAHELVRWLVNEAPPLVVTGRGGAILWDPDRAADTSAVAAAIGGASRAALADVRADLEVVAEHTRRFLDALVDSASLPAPDPATAQSGYSYLHVERRLIAYNLHEPGIERLAGPALPYARAMLGARTMHEWAHLAVDGGLVPRTVDDAEWRARLDRFAALLDDTIARASRAVRERTASDVRVLQRDGSAGQALAAIFTSRISDYQSNLLAFPFLSLVEREAYVRQNVRPLARDYKPEQLWRLLVRALYEYQYLGFSAAPDRRRYFAGTTWLERDLIAPGALDDARFDALAEAAAALCTAHAVDERRIRLPAAFDA
jgi:hypothetical protein